MPTSGDLKSGDFFSDQHPPPPMEFTNAAPPENFPLNLYTYSPPLPLPNNFVGKAWIYLSGTLIG